MQIQKKLFSNIYEQSEVPQKCIQKILVTTREKLQANFAGIFRRLYLSSSLFFSLSRSFFFFFFIDRSSRSMQAHSKLWQKREESPVRSGGAEAECSERQHNTM
jgi:hypothetical protein